MGEIVLFPKPKTNTYPIILPDYLRQELIELGYDPDNPSDLEEYNNDLEECITDLNSAEAIQTYWSSYNQ